MKRLSKRILSVMLSVLLAVTALPAGVITANADTADDLAAAKTSFTEKIEEMRTTSGSTNVVYTNLENAYSAYLKALDSSAGATEAANLNTEVGKMEKFEAKKASAAVSINGTTATGYYNNVLYASCVKPDGSSVRRRQRCARLQQRDDGHI